MIKVLLVDVDGVLVNGELFSKVLARDYGITEEMTASFFQGRFQECLVGNADLREELGEHLTAWGWPGSLDEFLTYWFRSEHRINEPLVIAIQQLRERGIRVYLATNQERYRTEYILEHMGFAEKFDGIFSSAHVKYTKSDPEFFMSVLRTLEDMPASDILFWDDGLANVATAQLVGIHAELYLNLLDFHKKMNTYLDVLPGEDD